MQIDLSEKDLKQLLAIVNFAVGIVEYTNDFIESPQVATRARAWGKIEVEVLKQAYTQGQTEQVEHNEYGYHIANTVFEKNMEITEEYDQLVVHQELSRALARRDLFEHYSEAEIKKMSDATGGYLGVALHPFEERYWNEFEEYEYSRLRIQDEPILDKTGRE